MPTTNSTPAAEPKRVWKFKIPFPCDEFTLSMPIGAKPLSFDVHSSGRFFLWALVNPDAPMVDRRFRFCGTGYPLPYESLTFIGSVQTPPFVWHLFEVGDQHRTGHLPTCAGIDSANRECQCGYLQGETDREGGAA